MFSNSSSGVELQKMKKPGDEIVLLTMPFFAFYSVFYCRGIKVLDIFNWC